MAWLAATFSSSRSVSVGKSDRPGDGDNHAVLRRDANRRHQTDGPEVSGSAGMVLRRARRRAATLRAPLQIAPHNGCNSELRATRAVAWTVPTGATQTHIHRVGVQRLAQYLCETLRNLDRGAPTHTAESVENATRWLIVFRSPSAFEAASVRPWM